MVLCRRLCQEVVKLQTRCTSTHVRTQWDPAINDRMSAWQVNDYRGINDLSLSPKVKVPPVTSPYDILVQVHSASVNALDIMMAEGYGMAVMNTLRGLERCSLDVMELPLTLGRDFSGTVLEVGKLVKHVSPGDPVWGVVGPQRPGTHAQYALASAFGVTRKPDLLTHKEAASVPFAGLTAWSVILLCGPLRNKKILVAGGAGGVGSVLLQLLHYYGAEVVTSCSSGARSLVESLGADFVVDYNDPSFMETLSSFGKYDCVVDCAGIGLGDGSHRYVKLLKECGRYISLSSPLLKHTDRLGLVGGTVKFASELLSQGAMERRMMLPAYFTPNPQALRSLCSMAEQGKIRPVIDSTFDFADTPEAYKRMKEGHMRGKVVINVVPEKGQGQDAVKGNY